MKKAPISIICGIAAVLITVVLYFTMLDNVFEELICIVTLFGIVLAEVVATAFAYFTDGDPRKVLAAVVSVLMVPVSIVLAVIYITAFPYEYLSYLGYYFVFFIALLLVSSVLWRFASSKKEENDLLQVSKEKILYSRRLIKSIMLEPGAQNYKRELSDIDEKLRFSNDSVITEFDAAIQENIIVLSNNINDSSFDVEGMITVISKEIDRRNVFAKKTL